MEYSFWFMVYGLWFLVFGFVAGYVGSISIFRIPKPTPFEILLCEIALTPPAEGRQSSLIVNAKKPALRKFEMHAACVIIYRTV